MRRFQIATGTPLIHSTGKREAVKRWVGAVGRGGGGGGGVTMQNTS